jgi:diguanylate cyclase (GGDEF)-like protein
MNLDLAGPGSSTTPEPALDNRSLAAWPLVLAIGGFLGMVVALELVIPRAGLPGQVLGPALALGAPLAILLAAGLAAWSAAPGVRSPWMALGSGALALSFTRLLQSMGGAAALGEFTLLLAPAGATFFHLALALAAILATRRTALHPRDIDALLDAALALAGAALLLEHLFFARVAGVAGPHAALAWSELVPSMAALVSFFCVVLLALRPNYRLPVFVPPFLLAAASCLLLGSVVDTSQVATPAGPEAWAAPLAADGLATLAGWTILALTGFASVRAARLGATIILPAPGLQRIHQGLIPGAALLLGAVALDASFRSGATLEVGLTGALLGLLLALRVRRTLRADEEHAEAQRLLAQNYALVELSRALADATDLNRTLDLVARWACRILDAPAAGVELLDAEQDELEIRALHGLPKHLLGLRTPVAGTLSGAVVRSGEARAVTYLRSGDYHIADRLDAFGTFPTAAAPLHYRDLRLGALFAIRFDRTFDDGDVELLGALADQASLAIRNAQLFEQVRALSLTDPLTGLANRRQLARDLNREFAAAVRGRQLIAVIFDLDNFKEYNDRYGHPAGDEVLRIFGQVLATETRAMNLAARYGGDEFVALLADTGLEGTETFIDRVATRFRSEMEDLGRMPVSISAGYAEDNPSIQTPADLIAAADKALYRVKPSRGAREGE